MSDFLQKLEPLKKKLAHLFNSAATHVPEGVSESGTSSSVARVLTGALAEIGESYFPAQIIGGACPKVEGSEEEIVWHAAAETCDTERVHVVWSTFGDKIWYLAVRSAELASFSGTWCPFASLLPGMKDSAPSPVCYLYYGDDAATMMVQTADGLQIYRGTAAVLRAKVDRVARDTTGLKIVELVPDLLQSLTLVPWYSLSMFEDRARRVLATLGVVGALSIAGLSFLVWLVMSLSFMTTRHNLDDVRVRTYLKTMDFMKAVEDLRSSPLRSELASFAEVNDALLSINGLMVVYEIKDGRARWRAVVPPSVTADRINDIKGKVIEMTNDGVVIGNMAEIQYEAAGGKK